MAEDTTTDTTTTGGGSPADSPAATTLTSEERDNQTIERLLGPTPKPAATTVADEDKGEDAADTKSDESEKPADGTASTEEDDADADEPELTDEELETILDAVGDKILEHPRISGQLEARIKAELDRRAAEQDQQVRVTREQEEIMKQGKEAVQGVYDKYGKAAEVMAKFKAELAKANEGQTFDGTIEAPVLDPEEVKKDMARYGQAVVIETGRSFNDNFMTAFREGAGLIGADQFTDEDGKVIEKILQTADRILKDEKQGRADANKYFFTESVKFLVERGLKAGREKALAEVQKKRDALKKIVGDGGENSTRAAVAKVAKQRAKTPPASPAPSASSEGGPATMERYRQLKREGKFDEADAVLAQMQA